MATRYEYYTSGEDWNESIFASVWYCQTFKVNLAFKLIYVRVKVWRSLNPGVGTVRLRAVSGGVPVGSDLLNTSYNWDTITSGSPGAYYAITLSAGGYSLTLNNDYAIILTAPSANGSSVVYWRADTSSGYANGSGHQSNNAGSTWQPDYGHDEMFETWGDPEAAVGNYYTGGFANAKRLTRGLAWCKRNDGLLVPRREPVRVPVSAIR